MSDAFDAAEASFAHDTWFEDEERDWGLDDRDDDFEPEALREPIVTPGGRVLSAEEFGLDMNGLVLLRNALEREGDRPTPTTGDTYPDRLVADDELVREPRQPSAPVTVTKPDGSRSTIALGGNVDAVRAFLAECVDPHGLFTFERLLEPTPAGRLPESERDRRDELARLVAAARSAGATLESIAAATNRSVSTASALAERGSALLGVVG